MDGRHQRASRGGERPRRHEVGGEDHAVAVSRDQAGFDDAHQGGQPGPPDQQVVGNLVPHPLQRAPLRKRGDGPRTVGDGEHRRTVEAQAQTGPVGELAQQFVEVPPDAGQCVEQGGDVDGHGQAALAAAPPDVGGEAAPPAPGGGGPLRGGPRERETRAGDAVRSPHGPGKRARGPQRAPGRLRLVAVPKRRRRTRRRRGRGHRLVRSAGRKRWESLLRLPREGMLP